MSWPSVSFDSTLNRSKQRDQSKITNLQQVFLPIKTRTFWCSFVSKAMIQWKREFGPVVASFSVLLTLLSIIHFVVQLFDVLPTMQPGRDTKSVSRESKLVRQWTDFYQIHQRSVGLLKGISWKTNRHCTFALFPIVGRQWCEV